MPAKKQELFRFSFLPKFNVDRFGFICNNLTRHLPVTGVLLNGQPKIPRDRCLWLPFYLGENMGKTSKASETMDIFQAS